MRYRSLAAITVASAVAFTQMAVAADLPAKAPVPPAPSVYNWTGWYAGVNAGGAWGHSDDPTSTVFSPIGYFAQSSVPVVNAAGAQSADLSGFTGGIQAGYNWQWSNLVTGIEADFVYFGLRGSSSGSGIYPCCAPAGFTVASSISTDWLATVRGRLGIANNNWLFFVTGGAAFTKLKGDFTFTDNCGNFATCNGPAGPNAAEAVSISQTKTGWTIGGGVEAGLWSKWTLKAEYLYLDFGSVSGVGVITTPGLNPFASNNPFTHSADLQSHIFRLGLNYRLN
jgi:outer membrane immunogenic protein